MHNEIKRPCFLNSLLSNCVIVDVETIGLNPKYDSIIEISALRITDDKISGEFSSLVNPERQVPPIHYKINRY